MRQEPEYYEDAHGNKIIGNYQGLKFVFSGFNSAIEIGDNVQFHDTVFCIHNDSKVVIGTDVQFWGNRFYIYNSSMTVFENGVLLKESNIFIEDEAKLEIKYKSKIAQLSIKIKEHAAVTLGEEAYIYANSKDRANWYIGKNAKLEVGNRGRLDSQMSQCILGENAFLKIGREFSINGRYWIIINKDTGIFIGDDCMFSYDIIMCGNDGHSIFDIETGENVNSTYEISRNRRIVIGNHVWIGARACILYNTQIGDGSIIGAMSLVKGKIPNNCIAVGIPAKVIKRNAAWCREPNADNIMDCGQEYIHYTEEK